MTTRLNKIVPLTPENIALSAELLKQGEAVVFPTDTVYGIGVDAFNKEAISKLYAIKERPLEKGLPILLSDASILPSVCNWVETKATQHLIDTYWPGALTLILPRHSALPDNISSNAGIALRIPDHADTRALIRAAGGAVATSSANISTQPAATTAQEAAAMLGDRVAIILDAGPSTYSTGSTILDFMVTPPIVRREGPLSAEKLLQEISE